MGKRKTNLERALARESAKLDLDKRGARTVCIGQLVGVEPGTPWGRIVEARASCALDGETQSCLACTASHEVRLNRDGTLDEIVGVGQFHLEQMSGDSWFLDLGGVQLNLSRASKTIQAVPINHNRWTDVPPPKPLEHACGQRPMTAEERAVVEAAMAYHADRLDYSISEDLADEMFAACAKLLTARKGGGRG